MLTKLTLHEISLVYDATLVSHHCGFYEEFEVRAREWGPETKHGSEDDFGCDLIDSCGDTGPRCREGPRARRVERGDFCEALEG